jgi:hypothetical protein
MSDNTHKHERPWWARLQVRICFTDEPWAHSRIFSKRCADLCNQLADRITAGGARRDRTDDLLLAKQALSQLSYGPAVRYPSKGGKWWAWEDLNFRPHAYQARALTN